MGDDADKKSTVEGLASVASHLRSRLGKSLRLRSAPEIHFRTDESVARAGRIETLLAQIRDEREQREQREPRSEDDAPSVDVPSAE
jgi:ribosome-binding factor A